VTITVLLNRAFRCLTCFLTYWQVYFDKNGSYPGAETLLNTYTYTFYWSTLTLAMMGDVWTD